MSITLAKPQLGEEERAAVSEVLSSGRLVQGPKVEEFERALASYCGRRHCIAVSSGTAALHVALLSLGVGAGDEVVVPDFTFIATANAARYCGAIPYFSDVRSDSFTLDPSILSSAINERTKAIVPVSLYGQAYAANEIASLASEKGIPFISDNAQALGSTYRGKRAFPDSLSILSFYATKTITTGEGGAILTGDDELADACRLLRNIGQRSRYEYVRLGYNYRMAEIAAAIGIAQLKKLDSFLSTRGKIARIYSEGLAGLPGITVPALSSECGHAYNVYTIQSDERDALKEFLSSRGIDSAIYYPAPLHSLPVFKGVSVGGDCPVSARLAARVLSLPMHSGLKEEDAQAVVDAVREFSSSH